MILVRALGDVLFLIIMGLSLLLCPLFYLCDWLFETDIMCYPGSREPFGDDDEDEVLIPE